MEIILARHGNTFKPNDPVVWTGSTNDLPLVEQGIAQAEKLASCLLEQSFRPEAIYCGPLLRTRKYAQILSQRLQLANQPIVDKRINEIDYGDWTGLTNDEVENRFGKKALTGWDLFSQWPDKGNWGSNEETIAEEVSSFVRDLAIQHRATDKIIVVTSNGRLRYFLKLCTQEFEMRKRNRDFKVKTGNICKLIWSEGVVTVSYWNEEPRAHLLR
jgi:probable phosphoglycerate mutase